MSALDRWMIKRAGSNLNLLGCKCLHVMAIHFETCLAEWQHRLSVHRREIDLDRLVSRLSS